MSYISYEPNLDTKLYKFISTLAASASASARLALALVLL